MGERTHHPPGTFSWIDLSTSDVDGAKRFYTELLGWDRVEDMPAGEGVTYSMAFVRDRAVAALFRGDGSVSPYWGNYVTVESADASAEQVEKAGGELIAPPFDVMSVGRMLVLKDPTGAILSLWEARESIGAERVNEPGCLTWNDLNTTDPEAAQAFYGALFGWTFDRVPGGYPYWVIRNGDRSNGGLRELSEGEREAGVPSHWLPYFAVPDADAAAARIGELGGRLMVPPRDVPNGRFAVAQDPQGAVFAVVFSDEFDD